MTTWPGNTLLLNGMRDAYVAYRVIGGVALVLGDPIGSPDGGERAIEEFLDLCASRGWVPCFYGMTPRYLAVYRQAGLRTLQIAEDTVIDLAGLDFKGRAWQDVRTALNKAEREGIRYEAFDGAPCRPRSWRNSRAISDAWTAEKGLPEMGFTLGTLAEAPDPQVRTASRDRRVGRGAGLHHLAADLRGRRGRRLDDRPDAPPPGWLPQRDGVPDRAVGAGDARGGLPVASASPPRRWLVSRARGRRRPSCSGCSTSWPSGWSRSTASARSSPSSRSSSRAGSRSTWSSPASPTCPGSASRSSAPTCPNLGLREVADLLGEAADAGARGRREARPEVVPVSGSR